MAVTAKPDEVPRPVVYHGCKRCGATMKDVYANRVVVSPQHVAHFGQVGGGTRACGKDATRDGWWWPL